MTTIYYESLPVAHLTFDSEWRLDYDPSWEARRPAFPVSLSCQCALALLLPAGALASSTLLKRING